MGPDQFTYTMRNSAGVTATATVSVTVLDPAANTAPVAATDNVALGNRDQLRVAVLDNDSDAEGDKITLVSVTSPTAFGSATITGRTIVYTKPVALIRRYQGVDQFTYTIRDPLGATATGTVNVTWTPEWDASFVVYGMSVSAVPNPTNPDHFFIYTAPQWKPIPTGMTMTLDLTLPQGVTSVGQPNDGRSAPFARHSNCSIIMSGGRPSIYRCTVASEGLIFIAFDLPKTMKSFNTTVTLSSPTVRDPVPANNKLTVRAPADCTGDIARRQYSCNVYPQ